MHNKKSSTTDNIKDSTKLNEKEELTSKERDNWISQIKNNIFREMRLIQPPAPPPQKKLEILQIKNVTCFIWVEGTYHPPIRMVKIQNWPYQAFIKLRRHWKSPMLWVGMKLLGKQYGSFLKS